MAGIAERQQTFGGLSASGAQQLTGLKSFPGDDLKAAPFGQRADAAFGRSGGDNGSREIAQSANNHLETGGSKGFAAQQNPQQSAPLRNTMLTTAMNGEKVPCLIE